MYNFGRNKKNYANLTSRFPIQSSTGNNYILVAYYYDANAIISEPIKNRTARETTKAHERMYEYFTSRELKPKYEVLNNDISNELMTAMRKHDITFQLVPPNFVDRAPQNE